MFESFPKDKKLRICLIGEKISILSRSTDTGLLWPLARGLSEQGHEVTIISSRSPLKRREVFRDGIRAYYLQENIPHYRHQRFSEMALKKFLTLHKDNPFDLVHSLDRSGYRIGLQKKRLRISMAYDIQATHLSELFTILTENQSTLTTMLKTSLKLVYRFLKTYLIYDHALLQTADGIFVTTPQQKLILERYYLYPNYHTYTVPYGINLGDLTPKAESENFKQKLNIPDNAKIILALSDFSNTFEVKPLLSAFRKLVLKKPNTFLILVGDGPEWKNVEFEMLRLALGSKVIMPGAVTAAEMVEFILASPIYVDLSARSTGLEPSLIEAMAQKKIVVGSELSPISEIIEDGADGFLVRPADVTSLFELLDRLTEEATDLSLEIGEKARLKVVEVFNRQKMINSLIMAYTQILQKSGRFKQRAIFKSLFSKPIKTV